MLIFATVLRFKHSPNCISHDVNFSNSIYGDIYFTFKHVSCSLFKKS